MRLQKLTGLERDKVEEEYQALQKDIEYYRAVLASERMLLQIIRKELTDVKQKFGDPRRTRITQAATELEVEDLIEEEEVAITLTHYGYIKRQPLGVYRSQRRGGRGITGTTTREEDFVEHLFVTTTHHYLLFFTTNGKAYRLKVHEVPEAGRTAKGTAVVNLVQLGPGEKVTAVIPVKSFEKGQYLFMATARGLVKKTELMEFQGIRRGGLIAVSLEPGDELIGVRLTGGQEEMLLVTRNGKCLRFSEKEVRPMGRSARGVIGIRLAQGDRVIGMDGVMPGGYLMVATARGYGKRTPLEEYTPHRRGSMGIRAIKLSGRTGEVSGVRVVEEGDDVMLVSAHGIIIRLPVKDVSVQGRDARGVTVMRLEEGDAVVAVARITHDEHPKG